MDHAVYQGGIRLVLFDVDGVLTDGSLHFSAIGEEVKTFNVKDGLAIALLRAHGIMSGVLSGRSSEALDYRVSQLGFDLSVTGSLEKAAAYSKIKRDLKLKSEQIAFVGDDVVDLPLAGNVGRFYAPSDAHSLVLERADHVVRASGGRGVAREVVEHLLLSGGLDLGGIYRPLIDGWTRFGAAQ